MKVSQRERILLVGLAFIVIIGGYIKFIFLNQLSKLESLNNEKNQCIQKCEEIKRQVLEIKRIKTDNKIVNGKIIEITGDYLPPLQEERVIVIADNLVKAALVNNDGFNISDLNLQTLQMQVSEKNVKNVSSLNKTLDDYNKIYKKDGNKETEKKDNSKSEDENKKGQSKDDKKYDIVKVSLNMNIKGTYDQFRKFIKVVESFPKKILISNLNATMSDKNRIMASVVLDFYYVPKPQYDTEDNKLLKWEYEGKYGKYNPFEGASAFKTETITHVGSPEEASAVLEQNQKETNQSDMEKRLEDIKNNRRAYDFVMAVKPISSDIPTLTMVKVGDRNKRSLLFADNEKEENVEVYITKKGEKYYYKYKTQNTSYPINFNSDGEQFIPSENSINMNIISCVRNSSSDVGGVKLNVYNKTDKQFYINIQKDDMTRPRVTVIKKEGLIAVDK